jgi:hypothetical protein
VECEECGVERAERARIEYVEDAAETLPLCEACRAVFADGDLVTDVTVIEAVDEDP